MGNINIKSVEHQYKKVEEREDDWLGRITIYQHLETKQKIIEKINYFHSLTDYL